MKKKNILMSIFLVMVVLAVFVTKWLSTSHIERPISSNDNYIIKANVEAEELFVIHLDDMNREEAAMIVSLQGLTSNFEEKQIYINHGSYDKWLKELESREGIILDYVSDPWQIFDYYINEIDGYILWSNGNDSINVATSLCSIYNAVLIEESLQDDVPSRINMIKDARLLDEQWLLANHMEDLNKELIIEQKDEFTATLRDYAIMANSMTFFDGNSSLRKEILDNMHLDSVLLGWGDASKGEDKFIGVSSKKGISTIPADHAYNLSVFSGFNREQLSQDLNHNPTNESDVHYVSFIMSDGDNVQWLLNDFSNENSGKWFGSQERGNFSMGWGMAPGLIDLAPTVMEYFYDQASKGEHQDEFIVGPSGNGYMYPSKYPELALKKHVDKLNMYMGRTDLSIVEVIDFRSLKDIELWDNYTRQEHIDGLIYLEYTNHAKHKGKVVWSNNKPVITPRAMLWEGLKNSDNESVVKLVNEASTDITSSDAYSVILVHAWSKSMSDISDVVNRFNEKVRIVTPRELVELMSQNVELDE